MFENCFSQILQSSGVLELISYWLKIISKALVTGFCKCCKVPHEQVCESCCKQYVFKNPERVSTPAAFRDLFMWLLAAFRNPFMTALAAFSLTSRISNGFQGSMLQIFRNNTKVIENFKQLYRK